LIIQIREAGGRIRLITDGDITAGLLAVDPRYDIDLSIGMGAAPEGVITASIAKLFGGWVEMRWDFKQGSDGDRQRRELVERGIDITRVLTLNDLVPGDCFVSLTAVTGNDFMEGVQFKKDGIAITHTISGRSRTGTIHSDSLIHQCPPSPPNEWPDPDSNQ
jgi:fructose-1,6-bisphosphatase/sedoheptulose 1,7-bisphosphatase-like protein